MKSVHLQEFYSLVNRYPRVLASTHCGTVEISKAEAEEWALRHSSPNRVAYAEEPPCFMVLEPTCVVIGTPSQFPASILIQKQGGGK